MDRSSIHWRRRWFYALWVALLGAALGAFALWIVPGRKGTGRLGVVVTLVDPAGITAELASFPEGKAPEAWVPMEVREGRWVGELQVPLSYRRWTGTAYEGRCHQGVLLRFKKSGMTRYYILDLRGDIDGGVFKPGRRMILEYRGLGWDRMYEDIPQLPRLP